MRVVLSTLEFGVNSTDLEVVQGSLEALAALASCHHSAVSSGADGIAAPQGALPTMGCFCKFLMFFGHSKNDKYMHGSQHARIPQEEAVCWGVSWSW